VVSRCSIPERTDRAAAIAPAISQIVRVIAQATVAIVQVIEAATAPAIEPKRRIAAAIAPREAEEATAPHQPTGREAQGEAASMFPRAGRPARLPRAAERASPVLERADSGVVEVADSAVVAAVDSAVVAEGDGLILH
jgi:hypothetical protein